MEKKEKEKHFIQRSPGNSPLSTLTSTTRSTNTPTQKEQNQEAPNMYATFLKHKDKLVS